jgi:hypothetical protein
MVIINDVISMIIALEIEERRGKRMNVETELIMICAAIPLLTTLKCFYF